MKYLQYIQGDSVHNWIDTGITQSAGLDVELTIAHTPTSGVYFGTTSYTVEDSEFPFNYWYYVIPYGTGTRLAVRVTVSSTTNRYYSSSDPWTIETPHTIKFVPSARTVYVDGSAVITKTGTVTGYTGTQTYYLGQRLSLGSLTNTTEAPCRLYGCKMWQSGTLVRDFVPVLENGVATLYDKVTGTVFQPGGTIPFTAGPQVPDLDLSQVKSIMVPVPADTQVLPYDAEVEYLESTGTQLIDTAINGSTPLRFRCDFSLTEGNVANNALFGAFTANNRLMVYIGGVNSDGANIMALGCGTATGQRIGISPKPVERHSILVNFANGDTWVEVDGGSRLALEGTTATNTINAYLFGRSGSVTTINARIYSATIFDGAGTAVRDFVPVRKNGVGYMYDKVSGQLFGNQGTGAFMYGQDTNRLPYDAEVEYLQTDGNCWIDTGIIPLLTDTVEMRQYVTDSGNGSFGTVGAAWRQNAYALYSWQFWLGSSSSSSIINPRGDAIWKIENKSLYKDGTLLQEFPDATGDPIRSIYLFAIHDYNTSPTYKLVSGCRVYSFRLIRNGEILADYIPVRKNGVGYMYDKITGGMFGNSGTGTLTYGNDKSLTLYPVEKVTLPKFPPVENAVEVEYVQTDGGKCFDTGIAIGTDIGIEMTFWMPEHTSGNYILGNILDWSTNRFQFGWFDYTTRQALRFDSYTTDNREFAIGYNKWRRLTYGNGIVQLDNEVKAYTPASIVTTANLYVMGRGSTDGYAGLRIKGCRVFKAGVLMRDLMPLKVGTEGCLYDKVTGTVLHATGTGSAISCGPEKTTAIWEHPIGYVKNGLIGWWDGIFNTRDGHSDMTTIWEDLGPNQFDAVARTSSSWRWLDKCYNGLSNTGEGFAIPRDFTNAIATALTNGGLTVEMVFACDENRRMSIFSQYGTGTGFEFYPQSYAGVYRSYFSGSPDVWANVWPTGGYATIHTGSTVVGGTVANVVAYGDGMQLATNATLPTVSTISSTYSFILGGENNRATMSINGRLYCVRVYNRALTPVEVARNAAVDRGRFGI